MAAFKKSYEPVDGKVGSQKRNITIQTKVYSNSEIK